MSERDAGGRTKKPSGGRVVIAGASGFIGTALARALHPDHHVIGLTRVPAQPAHSGVDEWRPCDLLSLTDAKAALSGVDHAYYLVHSMLPSARLTQGTFGDFDLIAADNFARASERAGVRQIIYLGGILPGRESISAHLRSRHEVERALRDRSVPVTAVRAGLVIGAGGASFLAMLRVVERLPFLLCPPWSRTLSHPIALADVAALLRFCLEEPETHGGTYDIGGPELMSYETMMRVIAQALGLKRRRLPLPISNTRLLQLGISLVSGAPGALIQPLIESLKYPIVARERRLNAIAGLRGTPFIDAVREAIRAIRRSGPRGHAVPIAYQRSRAEWADSSVRSVQRFSVAAGWTAESVARHYLGWLPRGLGLLVRIDVEADEVSRMSLRLLRSRPLLVLRRSVEGRSPDRVVFAIVGGLLARPGSRQQLEFRSILERTHVLIALHDYRPRLPWYLYLLTQARLHVRVMKTFSRYLRLAGPAASRSGTRDGWATQRVHRASSGAGEALARAHLAGGIGNGAERARHGDTSDAGR
jgi:uncharacterized protein YbjT (DUF2867 family)